MDKNDILKAAQNNGDRGKEYEFEQNNKAMGISAVVAVLVSVALFFIDYFVKGVFNTSLFIAGFALLGAEKLAKGIMFKKTWNLICGAIWCIGAIVGIILKVVL